MKKIFIISAILLGVLLLFLGIYNFAFKKKSAPSQQATVESIANPTNLTNSPIKTKKIAAISENSVIGPVFDKKTEEIVYYDPTTGFVWKMDADGKEKQQITNTKIAGLKSVTWSPDNKKVLTTTLKDGQYNFYMYDYQSQKGTLLKNGLDTAVWDNLGTKIFYKYYDINSKQRTLNIANPDGSDWQKVADIKARNLVIEPIPLTSLVSFWNFPDASDETQLQIVGATGGEPKTILNGKYGADYLWSPDGSKALVSALSSKESRNTTLGVVEINGKYQDLNIPTLVSKSVWSKDNKTVYYTLPGAIPADAKMPNDYQENKFNTEDTFWKMDVTNGEKDRAVETSEIDGKYDASKLFLSSTEDALYFVNKVDQKLYKIEL